MKEKEKAVKIIGLDEAGRGPLAGPVVAVAVSFKKIPGIELKDSKKYSEKKREEAYRMIMQFDSLEWGIGVVSEKIIDKINILEATKLAMKKALAKISCENSVIIIDGNFKLNVPLDQKSIVKADEKILECSAASIIAKVERDRLMQKYHKKYPCYNFDMHKGYGTKHHKKMIKKHGACPLHRKSFRFS